MYCGTDKEAETLNQVLTFLTYRNLGRPGPVAQSVARLIADLGVISLILAWSHTFLEIITYIRILADLAL